MHCSILGLGTAVPPATMRQEDVLAMSTDVICENPKQTRLMQMLFRKAGIETRQSCIPPELGYKWKQASEESGRGAGTAERMRLYRQFAGPLATEAAAQALDDAATSTDEITHIVTVSCTGFGAPGVDIELIQSLGLRPTTQRVHVGFMGCHGAINGIRAARGLVAANPGAKVLMCAVELCSLHYRLDWDDEGIIGNALFADGAAAIVVTDDPGDRAPVWNIEDTGCCLIPETTDAMSWHIGDYGFDMRLTGEVANAIERSLHPWMTAWLDLGGHAPDDIATWAVHPGGPRILDAVEAALHLPAEATAISREVLRTLGNMSSPTVLFILDRMRLSVPGGPTVVLAFGPGLMAEAALLSPPD